MQKENQWSIGSESVYWPIKGQRADYSEKLFVKWENQKNLLIKTQTIVAKIIFAQIRISIRKESFYWDLKAEGDQPIALEISH